MTWQPGLYDRRIMLRQKTRIQSSLTGAFTESFSDWKSVPARRIINSGIEVVTGDRRENDYSVTWEIPYLSGVDADMRVLYSSEEYSILSVIEMGRKEKIKIETELVR